MESFDFFGGNFYLDALPHIAALACETFSTGDLVNAMNREDSLTTRALRNDVTGMAARSELAGILYYNASSMIAAARSDGDRSVLEHRMQQYTSFKLAGVQRSSVC